MLKPAFRKDDCYFPLSHNVYNSCFYRKTFPPVVWQQIEPPLKTVKKLFFPTNPHHERNKFFEPSFTELVANENDGHIPLELHHQETWRSFTKADIEYTVGFRDVIPHGFEKEAISNNSLFYRPGWEKAVFDPHAPLGEYEGTYNPNKNEVEAREFLENHQELRFKWSGCAQLRGCLTRSKLYHCCHKQNANFADENEELHNWRDFHNRVECPRNDDFKCVLGNLDVSKKTSNGQSLIHMYIVKNMSAGSINRIGTQAKEIIGDAKALSERDDSQMDKTPLGQDSVLSPVAEWNMGLMQVSLYTHEPILFLSLNVIYMLLYHLFITNYLTVIKNVRKNNYTKTI